MDEAPPTRTGALVAVAVGVGLAVLLVAGLVVLGARQPDRSTADPTANRPSESPGPAETGLRIPDDFPLLAGYPTREAEDPDGGRRGPTRTLPPIVLEACGQRVDPGAHTDLLRAAWTDVEDFRQRQLTTYADEGAAQAYVDAILGAYRGCPSEDTGDGYTSVRSILDSGLGDVSVVAATRYERDGDPAIGHTLVQVVRVGATVLVAASSNEGGGGPEVERQLRDAAAAGGAEIEDVVARMCLVTATGC